MRKDVVTRCPHCGKTMIASFKDFPGVGRVVLAASGCGCQLTDDEQRQVERDVELYGQKVEV